MANYIYGAIALTGGGVGALDAIDGDDLQNLDAALVFTGTTIYQYSLDIDSGSAESSPEIIAPDANPGDKRWILIEARSSDISVDVSNFNGILTSTEDNLQKALEIIDDCFNSNDFTIVSGVAELDSDILKSISTDSGSANGSTHAVTIAGGNKITTSGSGSTVTINLDDLTVATKTSTYTITVNDNYIVGDTAGGNFSLTLPAAADKDAIRISKLSDDYTLTIQRAGSDTIEGAVSIALTDEDDSIFLISNGSNRWVQF